MHTPRCHIAEKYLSFGRSERAKEGGGFEYYSLSSLILELLSLYLQARKAF